MKKNIFLLFILTLSVIPFLTHAKHNLKIELDEEELEIAFANEKDAKLAHIILSDKTWNEKKQEIMKAIQNGANPNTALANPLIHAIKAKDKSFIKWLLDHGVDPNSESILGSTAHDHAKITEDESVKELLKQATK
ncbi:MAG: ankyrin repeat domain-containing protein [Candidatus Babeliales bacterium]